MQPAVLIRLRPTGPWRYGPGEGGHDRVDTLFRSDRLYSAFTLAMKQLGFLDEWLEATARSGSAAVAFTSLFPFQGDTLFVPPPSTLWPPPASLVTTPSPVFLSKIRWRVARFVPLTLVESLLLGQNVLADQWAPDPESACLLRRDRPNTPPFHVVVRSSAAVDRLSKSTVSIHNVACVEFEVGAGLWTVARYQNEQAQSAWGERVEAAFRLLSDTGFGGKRSSGWGQTATPEFQKGDWPGLLLPKLTRAQARLNGALSGGEESSLYWLLSLYSPSTADEIDWESGAYEVTLRGGRVDSSENSGATKKHARMITEGSVLAVVAEPAGAAVDVAPDGFAHPVYRSGVALALKLPTFEMGANGGPVEEPSDSEPPETAARIETPAPAVLPDDPLPEPESGTETVTDSVPDAQPETTVPADESVEDIPSNDPNPEPRPEEEHQEHSDEL